MVLCLLFFTYCMTQNLTKFFIAIAFIPESGIGYFLSCFYLILNSFHEIWKNLDFQNGARRVIFLHSLNFAAARKHLKHYARVLKLKIAAGDVL